MTMLGFLALLGALAVAPPCETGVCRCTPPPDVQSARDASAAVFTGTVLSVRDTMIGRGAEHPFRMRAVTLQVDRAWKGVDSRTFVVLTGTGSGDCGFPFRPGESYLVYAGGDWPIAYVCGRTAPLARADADIHALGPAPAVWQR
ncbi:MAG TPA: hypothetical protein VGX50_00480 [Longimicrobium sp.]|nr:hypothetical protein [Longimicrobium sp.]